MKIGLLAGAVLFARFACAATPYDAAQAALVGVSSDAAKEIDALLARPSDAALGSDARAIALLSPNQNALELFRRAAQLPNDGYLFQPKIERYDSHTPEPNFSGALQTYRLLLLDAKVEAARGHEAKADGDLLAAVDFMIQASAQKSGALISVLVEQISLKNAAPLLAESERRRSASSAYLKELAARLDTLDRGQDFMATAFLELDKMSRGGIRESVTPTSLAEIRENYSFLNRILAREMMDAEFCEMVYALDDAATDESTRARLSALRANDPEIIASFLRKRMDDIAARKKAQESVRLWSKLADMSRGGKKTKHLMAEALTDTLNSIAIPDYRHIVTLHHVFLNELAVQRAALALERYRRDRRRLPEDLAALVPAYLPAVPRDSFNHFAPLRYIPAGNKFTVYGLGPTRKDDGGALELNWSGLNDDFFHDSGSIIFRD